MGKNTQKVQDMLDGNHKRKLQVGMHTPEDVHSNRKVGDKWTDSDGVEWEQKQGYRSKVSKLAAKGLGDNCPDCKSLIVKKWDKDSYKWNGRCYYCQIDFEAGITKTRKLEGSKEDILNQFVGKKGAKKWKALSEKEKQSVLDSVLDGKDKYIISKIENYLEGYKEEQKIWKKEIDGENKTLFDKSVVNAMANENVEMSIKKHSK